MRCRCGGVGVVVVGRRIVSRWLLGRKPSKDAEPSNATQQRTQQPLHSIPPSACISYKHHKPPSLPPPPTKTASNAPNESSNEVNPVAKSRYHEKKNERNRTSLGISHQNRIGKKPRARQTNAKCWICNGDGSKWKGRKKPAPKANAGTPMRAGHANSERPLQERS